MGIPLYKKTKYSICGIPFDYGTSNRPGTRFGPSSIRAVSRMLLDGEHPYHWVNPIDLDIADVGDLDIVHGDIIKSLYIIEKQADNFNHLITLGGDHIISLALLRSVAKKYGPVALIHFDAHMDTWQDNYNGIPFGHGNPFFHAINEKLINPNKMIQIGIRSPIQKNIFDWTKQKGVHIWTAEDVHETNVKIIIDYIKKELQDLPVYLTIDIDVLDPAYAPGTGTPEIGGLHSWQVQKILRYLTELNFVGMDIVEVSPPYDVNEITSLAAATFVWEYLALLKINETIKNENIL